MTKKFYPKKYYFFFLIITVLIGNTSTKNINVLIKEYSCKYFSSNNSVKIESENGFLISNPEKKNQRNFIDENEISLFYDKNNEKLFINSRGIKSKSIEIKAKDNGFISFDNSKYEGSLIIIIKDDFLYLINKLNLENYLIDVLASETIASWPHESHKVSSIIMRTYAAYKIDEAKKVNRIYDLKATIHDQLYEGHNYNEKIANAINETSGLIIKWQNKPIMAMYHICCGGAIPANITGFDFNNFPYLNRKEACNFCKNSKNANWSIKISLIDSAKRLSAFLNKNITEIIAIDLIKKSKSGAIKKIILKVKTYNSKNKKGKIEFINLDNKSFRKAFSINLSNYSSLFCVSIKENNFIINGKGRGHLMGLCQTGAKIMVDENKNYEEIIKFYYPNTTINFYEQI